MTTFSRSIDIAAAPERVWAIMSDLDRWHEWTPSIRGITRQGGAPLAPGTRVVIRQPKFPPALWTITDVQPGRSFTWVSRAPGMSVTGTHAIAPVGDGSRVTLSLQYEGAVGTWLARLTRGITERYVGYEAEGLRARSEESPQRDQRCSREGCPLAGHSTSVCMGTAPYPGIFGRSRDVWSTPMHSQACEPDCR